MSTTSQLRKLGSALCLIAGLAAFGSGFAQDGSPVQVTNAVYQEIQIKAEDGTISKKMVPAARVVPGEEVVYELSYRNDGDTAANNVQVNNALAKELEFVSASNPPTVSIDGGEHFGDLSELKVTAADGSVRPAQPSDITNVRWTVPTLAPGASGKFVYRARVK